MSRFIVLSYTMELLSEDPQDLLRLRSLLEDQKFVFNIISNTQFFEKKRSIVILHSKVYKPIKSKHPKIKSNVIIAAENECLSRYKSAKSNKHKLTKPIEKNNLSIQLNKNLFRRNDNSSIYISTDKDRKKFKFKLYPKLEHLLSKYKYKDPTLFINENNNKIFISFPFDVKPEIILPQTKAIGVDLGIRRSVAMSNGTLIIDKKFNGEIRKLRHLKNALKSKGTKSAKKHLKKLKRKEHNKNNNQCHFLANMILKTDADTLVFEDLKGIKKKKNKFQNKRRISQVSFCKLLQIVTYKALHQGKRVVTVSPFNTSKINFLTGKIDGIRQGCRYYTSDKNVVLDSDLNGSNNIVLRSKHPTPCICSALDGQATVNMPNECKSKNNISGIQILTHELD